MFPSDNTGFYEKWCVSHDGVWFEPVECRFEYKIDYNVAMRDLENINHVEITGRYADQICEKMDILCPEGIVLDGYSDTQTGNVKYAGHNDDVLYYFQIIGDNLFYKKGDTDDKWELVITNNTRYNNDDGKYTDLWQFNGDELGYYENWCKVFDGDWIAKSYECGFKDHSDYNAAKKEMKHVVSPIIEGKQAMIFCEILQKDCDDRIVFSADYDPRTDVTHYEGWINEHEKITIRIIDGQISYTGPDNYGTWIDRKE